ncbi:nitroreductase family deazaflavin-dependent oxidoreductase [Pseudonocardia sp. KRD291]|uniref:nitroreductase family deazaflavin-dependent oxidoreductase n=1 Tax=Pseudonocardia sp. KRD291 TaxID=2792007 RepID=UPI001C4A51F3|nr:nitroreductase family deazaflavin-dependent oxidoreductase [Pseudonocardia sp. KRD291]MBW0101771.1 nitroreductase family deazaflavin-dependent oxidoreductase [Pseudonocardia sp. KRD291]
MPVTTSPVFRAVVGAGERLLRSRTLVRAPILVYRLGLGRVFGSRMLLLEHTGRRSGLRREVVLEVVGRPAGDRYVVVSGFGGRAQWFRNVRADPNVRVSVSGDRALPATARALEASEARYVLAGYVERHRRAWAWFGPVLERTLGGPIEPGGAPPPMVELRLRPPGR